MQKPPRPTGSPDTPEPPDSDGPGNGLSTKDAVRLLHLMGAVASVRADPRKWRTELLQGLNDALGAAASATFTLKNLHEEEAGGLQVSFIFDVGFSTEERHAAFLHEFNAAAFRDPFSAALLGTFAVHVSSTYTARRADLVDDATWAANLHVLTYRKATGMDDVMLSMQRGPERGAAHVLAVFKEAVTMRGEGGPRAPDRAATARFTPRDRVMLDVMHRGMSWLYKAEESVHKINRASSLPPRLKQTLEFLLTGHTERHIADQMSLSVHTVHDYVKSIYAFFGVSSRTELLSRWMQSSGSLPQKPREET